MNKITAVFSILLVFLTSVLSAEPMLKISALSGEVDCSVAGAPWKAAVLNQELNTSDKIRTGNGKAELLFAEGTSLKLKENSLLDLINIQCAAQKQNSSLKLILGAVKAKVTKLSAGGSFEVSSPKIIAAVKGTEFSMETTGDITEVRVLEGIVAVSELLREKEIFVRENERAGFRDGLLENPRQMNPSEIQGVREGYEVSQRGLFNARSAGFGGSETEKEAREIRELRSDLAEVKDRSNLEDKQDLLERISDVQLGKTTMDMHGYRLRTDNYVLRPQPDILQLLNITKREGGPDAGISSFEINDTFNKNLPENYMDVKIALRNNSEWFDNTKFPSYYLKTETAAIRNPHGDVILNEVTLTLPLWNNTASKYEQPFNETFKINSNLKWSHDYNASFQETYKDNNPLGGVTGTALPYTVSKPVKTSDGGFLVKDTYADGTYLEKYVYLIDESGAVQPLSDIDKGNLVWEMIYKAPEFGTRSIDLIVIPAIFGELF